MQPTHTTAKRNTYGQNAMGGYTTMETYGDIGTAARFFPTFRYQAKASRAERNRGCEGLEAKANRINAPRKSEGEKFSPSLNSHPTVKSLALMNWLISLVTPPDGLVLDPFAGSGSTCVAAKAGGWRYIGIEREAEYVQIAEARLAATSAPGLGSATAITQPKPVKSAKPTPKPRAKRRPAPTSTTTNLWEMRA
jgi:site-specific DNA-methyltransferase (adenine-specific)